MEFYRVLVRTSIDGIEQNNDVIVIAANEWDAGRLARSDVAERLDPDYIEVLDERTVPIIPDAPRVVAVELDVPG